jgi:NADPH-dependent 2,4-dienoyl-CoA reductase/sulfur reductase-like enzyme
MGENVSYANCGLPYFLSDTISDRNALLLQTPESLHSRFRLDVQVNHMVTAINKNQKSITVKNLVSGESFEDHYDFLVLATGAKPRQPEINGIEYALSLRDVADADALKAAVQKSVSKTAVIIGGGFIGIETAENLVHAGFEVHLVQRGSQLLGQVEPEIVEVFQKHLESNGIKLHLNSAVTGITPNAVSINGNSLECDLVV